MDDFLNLKDCNSLIASTHNIIHVMPCNCLLATRVHEIDVLSVVTHTEFGFDLGRYIYYLSSGYLYVR